MSVTEKNALMRAKDVTGNSFLIYPVTKAENVDGLDALLLDKADSKDLAEVATSGSWNDLLDKPQGSPVLYDQPQTLTPEQRAMANDNICMRMYDWHTLSSESVPENMRSMLDVQWSPAANATQAINYADPDALLAVTGGKLYGTNDVTYDCSAMHQFAYYIGVVPRLNQIYMDKISENVEHVIEAYELMASQVENNTHGDPITFAILPDSYTRFARYSGYVRRETHTDGVTHYIGYDAGSVREGSITWNDDTKTLVSYTLAYPHISSSGKYTTGLAADAATVKADLDNKISIPATSEAGQLLSVKSVDESGKPAEFEAVDADYYTEVEIDSKLSEINTAIAGKSESGHNHDDKYATKTELNSAADQATTYINSELAKKASKDELTTHTSNTTSHITSTERTNWNAAKTHADSAHAPSNAEKNQNAFSNVAVGSTTIAADSATDTLILAGSNVTITPDATNDKVTISITKDNVTSALGYTPPTTNTTYSAATTSTAGLMSASDKSKLDGIASGATNITVDSALSSSSTNPVQNNVINTALDSKANTDHAHDNYMTNVNPAGTGSFSLNRKSGVTVGSYSIAMGNNATAAGDNSIGMGYRANAEGSMSLAIGGYTKASGYGSMATGFDTKATGDYSSAMGYNTTAASDNSHVVGKHNVLDNDSIYSYIVGNGSDSSNRSNAHTIDWDGNAWFAGDVYVGSTSGTNKDEGSKKLVTVDELATKSDTSHTHNYAGSSSAGGAATSAIKATQDGDGNAITSTYMTKSNPTGTGSVSIGRSSSTVIGLNSVAMGNDTIASGSQSVAMGCYATASGYQSVAMGYATTASGSQSVAMGDCTTSSGSASTASGCNTNASGDYSTASGCNTNASGDCSTASGYNTNANGDYSTAIGFYTISEMSQFVAGKYNTNVSGPPTVFGQDSTNSDALFLIGHGTNINGVLNRANAFRVTSGGKCFGTTAFGASGADFAELFEWTDGNPNNEDRRGLFVALDGEKIKIANEGDDYIGVISGAQAFIGNSASEEWQGKYLTDVFGERLTQEIEVPEVVDEETGEVITPATTATQYVINPDYDPDQDYTMRENRKEWGIVGLLGQIVMIDDGTCVAGGHVKPSANGIGTASDSGYRVMKRIDENHIKVLVK